MDKLMQSQNDDERRTGQKQEMDKLAQSARDPGTRPTMGLPKPPPSNRASGKPNLDHYFNPETYKPGEAAKLQPSRQSVNLSKTSTDPTEE